GEGKAVTRPLSTVWPAQGERPAGGARRPWRGRPEASGRWLRPSVRTPLFLEWFLRPASGSQASHASAASVRGAGTMQGTGARLGPRAGSTSVRGTVLG